MNIIRFNPAPQLAKFVKCYYYIENPKDRMINDVYFADGCVEAVFSLGWDFYKEGKKEDWAKVIGQIIKPRQLSIQGKGQSFGIWFHPHTFSIFSGVPMVELNDCVVPWEDLFPKSFAEFVGSCIYDAQLDKLVQGTDEFLLARVSGNEEKPLDKILDSAVQYLYQNRGGSDLNQLADSLNISHRYLQRAFLSRVGFSQKHFIRTIRFQQVLQVLTQGDWSNLTSVAYANDFYDQSHFIREFKAFTGFNPSEFQTVRLPINQHFISGD
jgi:AraC-like DNA-binding protein